MTKLRFHEFGDCDDGKMAMMEILDETEIPINACVDNYEDVSGMNEGDVCYMDVFGVGSDIEIYRSEEEFKRSGSTMAPKSLIPTGTFSVKPDDADFRPTPHILFAGMVREVEVNPDAEEDDANYCLAIESYCLNFYLYLRYDGEIEVGDIAYGIAWLFGDLCLEDDMSEEE